MSMTQHQIVFGDSRSLNKIKDKSVQLIITSPPYWQLKDYGTEDQIGFNNNYEEYINNLNLVWIWQKTTTMNTSGGGAIMGSFPYPRNGILKIDYEFILIFKKLGNAPKPTPQQKSASELTKDEWKEYFSSHWNFNGVKQMGHIAMFPEELPKRLIKMFSFVGETVFDPFAGSGTTSLAAKHLDRNSIGYEINKEFESVIRSKLCSEQMDLFDEDSIVFLDDNAGNHRTFEELPYIFHDPHSMDKKIDVKKLQFGSRIDGQEQKRDELFTVRKVINPNTIELGNGLIIKLLGIQPDPQFESEAISFLREKFSKRRIFLKYDTIKYDAENNLLCYVYLDNKTFVNNHLVRTGYVRVDTQLDYSCKNKFLNSLPV